MNKLAYSTDSGSHKKDQKKGDDNKYQKSDGPIKIRIEKKGRGGKSVTVIYNLGMDKAAAKDLKKSLSSRLSVGSTLKEGRIELQGDHVAKCIEMLNSLGLKAVKSGG